MTANAITKGTMPTLINLAIRKEEPERAAPISSLLARKIIRLTIAAMLTAVVSPIAAIVVTVVTVLVVIVIINFFFLVT